MTFILKQNCAFLGQNKYESTTETVTKIIKEQLKINKDKKKGKKIKRDEVFDKDLLKLAKVNKNFF